MPKNIIIAVLTVLLGLSVAFALVGANTDDGGCDPVCQWRKQVNTRLLSAEARLLALESAPVPTAPAAPVAVETPAASATPTEQPAPASTPVATDQPPAAAPTSPPTAAPASPVATATPEPGSLAALQANRDTLCDARTAAMRAARAVHTQTIRDAWNTWVATVRAMEAEYGGRGGDRRPGDKGWDEAAQELFRAARATYEAALVTAEEIRVAAVRGPMAACQAAYDALTAAQAALEANE